MRKTTSCGDQVLGQPSEEANAAVAVVSPSDAELLRTYAATQSESAFAQLAARHLDWVYWSALRQVGNSAAAQDITQTVFIILARKAATLRRETVLSGWLFRAVRFVAKDVLRSESRRLKREQEAAAMQLHQSGDTPDAPWEEVAPLLDDALASLGAKDQQAVLLRFFAKRSFGEIGQVLGGNENAARVRVVRAVEKLRGYFRKRGVALSALALSGALFSQAVPAAPAGLSAALASGARAANRGDETSLGEALLRYLRWRRVVRIAGWAALFLLFLSVGVWGIRQRQVARATAFAASARSLSDTLVAIDRAFMFNDPDGFLARLHFRNARDERFKPVLSNYIRAESAFRREMQQTFNVQQRTFDLTFRELCVGQPAIPTNYIGLNRAATNVMLARYPFHLIRTDGAWKWNLFEAWPGEASEERLGALARKAQLLEAVAREVHDGAITNLSEILHSVQNAP